MVAERIGRQNLKQGDYTVEGLQACELARAQWRYQLTRAFHRAGFALAAVPFNRSIAFWASSACGPWGRIFK